MAAIAVDGCDGTPAHGTCPHTCVDAGYEGGSITCSADGTYTVSPCVEKTCTALPPPNGYTVTNTSATTTSGLGLDYDSCISGYGNGSPSVICNNNVFTYSGCTEVTCTRPSTTGYDFSGATETLTGASFSATGIICSPNYSGTPQATVCAADGEYTVSGCEADTNDKCTGNTDTVVYPDIVCPPNTTLRPQGIGRTIDECCVTFVELIFSGTCDDVSSACNGNQVISDAIANKITDNAGISNINNCGQIPNECTTCSSRTCEAGHSPIDPPPNNTACSGFSQGGSKICLESDCCETSQPFTNMEGFQNNYQVVSMAGSYLIEGLENQQTFEIPIRLTIEPKDDTINLLSREEVNRIIDGGIDVSGIKIGKSIRKKNKEKQESKKASDQYKIIGTITAIVVVVSIILYVVYRSKKTDPILDLLS